MIGLRHPRQALVLGLISSMKRLSLPVAVFGLLLQAAGQAMAGPVLDFTGGTAIAEGSAQTAGWEFVVTSPITVSALGIWDEKADGLAGSHQLGLWAAVGAKLLTSAVITTANSTPVASTSSAGDWRFTPIVPLTLAPGDYFVGATFDFLDEDPMRVVTNAPSTTAGVTFFTAAIVFGTGLVEPSEIPGLSPGIFGPNLFVGPFAVAAPEPSALLLFGSGLAGLACLTWRRSYRK